MPLDPGERPSHVPWPPILLAVLLAPAWWLGRVAPLPWPGGDGRTLMILGWVLLAGAVALVLWAGATMLAARTTVRPDARVARLVVAGPFRLTRNPMYLCEVIAMLGLAIVTHSLWFGLAAALFAVLVTRLAIVREERHLEARFGAEYLAYKAKVRRWI